MMTILKREMLRFRQNVMVVSLAHQSHSNEWSQDQVQSRCSNLTNTEHHIISLLLLNRDLYRLPSTFCSNTVNVSINKLIIAMFWRNLCCVFMSVAKVNKEKEFSDGSRPMSLKPVG